MKRNSGQKLDKSQTRVSFIAIPVEEEYAVFRDVTLWRYREERTSTKGDIANGIIRSKKTSYKSRH